MTPSRELPQPLKRCKRWHLYDPGMLQCPECKKSTYKSWVEKNADYLKKFRHDKYLENRERRIKQAADWRNRNYERWKTTTNAYVERNRERIQGVQLKNRRKNRERVIWANMIRRCTVPSNISYHSYGARGITVCEMWTGDDGFTNFMKDMGTRPSPKHSIDRIDNSKGYSPDNCHWATSDVQNRNTRRTRLFEFNGKKQCMTDWANELGITPQLLWTRISYLGWPLERALTTGPYRRAWE